MQWRTLAVAAAFTLASSGVSGAEPAGVGKPLGLPVLKPQETLAEAQAYCESRVPPMPMIADQVAWARYAEGVRQEVLARVVFRGEAAAWRDLPLKVEWRETIAGGPGYRIRKLIYEALPGLWIPALVYEPEKLEGNVPVILNVNGHDPKGKAAPYKQ